MKIDHLKRKFITGDERKKTSVNLHLPLVKGLEQLSEKTGKSVSDLIADAADQLLCQAVREKLIPDPDES